MITITCYMFSRKISLRFPHPLTTPIFTSTIFIILIFLPFNISYQDYSVAHQLITYWLGPATVALALPLYQHRKTLQKHFIPVLFGGAVGSMASILSAVYLAKVFHISEAIVSALTVKSVTTPVAVEVGKFIHADATIVAIIVILTGILGAMFGGVILSIVKVQNPVAKGLAFGVIAHGIGTAQAIKEGQIEGAVSGVAMALSAIITAIIIPLFY
ncbi:LrgB family protein [Rossellomorea sp. BNER]|nr:LrgB family protein [Rossellomorea sp. BNER]